MLLPVNMLWIGSALGRLERLSVKSYLAAGHEVRLHTYSEVGLVPTGVTICDASKILSLDEATALRHRETGSFALASDLFRYRLMQAREGLWSDIDVVCLRPLNFERQHLFGWESQRRINGAILYLAPESPILADVMNAFRANIVPAWLSLKRKAPFFWKRATGQTFGPRDLPWGSFGPRALTYLALKHGLEREALPRRTLYPVPLRDAQRIFDSDYSVADDLLSESIAVHLWNERLKFTKDRVPAPGSLLDTWFQKFGV
jgi:Alpha 1,4-glycosyltransferase conserved region